MANEGYSVEFSDMTGSTVAVVTLPATDRGGRKRSVSAQALAAAAPPGIPIFVLSTIPDTGPADDRDDLARFMCATVAVTPEYPQCVGVSIGR